jgi:hypothetical protein
MRTRRIIVLFFWICLCGESALAQTPSASDGVAVSGSLRTRSYTWNWFGDNANGDYTYPGSLVRLGLVQSKEPFDWQVEIAAPLVFRLPPTAVMPTPQGQLGLGASYFAANASNTHAAAIFLKQGFIRVKDIGGISGQSLKFGRMEFNDGAEVTPNDITLAALKRDRISQRLLGTFGFTDVGRSFDGAQYSVTNQALNLTALAGRPTQGVFDVDGWPELKVNVFYGALTGQAGRGPHRGEWRGFALVYGDYRPGVVKTDNRPLATRTADTKPIVVETYGGHYLQVLPTAVGAVDFLAWGAVQRGSWGALAQRAGAYAVEAGWQPTIVEALKPWLRVGYDEGSGDHNAADDTHGTFFQVLPTPRTYARLPFFNLMNTRDVFGELQFKPLKRMIVRSDVHSLRLASANDLWYSGGGAFQASTFGYTGRPSNGHAQLATLSDVSGDYSVTPHLAVGAYYGIAVSHAVAEAIFPTGTSARFGYVELLARF